MLSASPGLKRAFAVVRGPRIRVSAIYWDKKEEMKQPNFESHICGIGSGAWKRRPTGVDTPRKNEQNMNTLYQNYEKTRRNSTILRVFVDIMRFLVAIRAHISSPCAS